jgi:endonuclease YncB( thermonuclease family)
MNPASGKVLRIIDGDTIEVAFRVRLRNANAPEIDTRAGQIARDVLQASLPPRSRVLVEVFYVDAFGRFIATVRKGGL